MKRIESIVLLLLFFYGFTFAVSAGENIIQFTVKGVPFQMVKVEGGSGGTYYIGRTEVTQALWKAVMGSNPSYFKGDQNPVDMVTYLDCEEFIKKLNALSGQQFRIPSGDEWEYAAKGGKYTHGYKFSGSDDMGTVGWFKENSDGRTHPVAQKKPNELGIYDMTGNVNEWTTEYSYDEGGRYSPHRRGIRGSNYHCYPFLGGVENHDSRSIDNPEHGNGLRLVLSKPKPGSYIVVNNSNNASTTTKPSDDLSLKITVKGVTFEMIKVEGGTFKMGSANGEPNERPIHSETVKTFYMGKTEVTEALWQAVMGNNPAYTNSSKPVAASWNDCQEFISRLNKLTDKHFRLPTEAEWEYAARGGNRSKGYKYSGSNDINSVAWYAGNRTNERVHKAAQKAPNELGLYDMSGNVWEWCSDAFCENYSAPRNSPYRVLRGGAWNNEPNNCGVAFRAFSSPQHNVPTYGLRLVLQ